MTSIIVNSRKNGHDYDVEAISLDGQLTLKGFMLSSATDDELLDEAGGRPEDFKITDLGVPKIEDCD